MRRSKTEFKSSFFYYFSLGNIAVIVVRNLLIIFVECVNTSLERMIILIIVTNVESAGMT